jgi:hypothetical protein
MVVIGGILSILMVLFLEKKESPGDEDKLNLQDNLYFNGWRFEGRGSCSGNSSFVLTVSLLGFASHTFWRMVLGIILTLRIFGQFKFAKGN